MDLRGDRGAGLEAGEQIARLPESVSRQHGEHGPGDLPLHPAAAGDHDDRPGRHRAWVWVRHVRAGHRGRGERVRHGGGSDGEKDHFGKVQHSRGNLLRLHRK